MCEISEEMRSAYDDTDTQLGIAEGLLTALDDVITQCQTIAPTCCAHSIQVLLDSLLESLTKAIAFHEAEWRALDVQPKLVAAE